MTNDETDSILAPTSLRISSSSGRRRGDMYDGDDAGTDDDSDGDHDDEDNDHQIDSYIAYGAVPAASLPCAKCMSKHKK